MKKRGISPLIATILLIGFAIAIAAVVFTWGRGYVTETAEKEGSLSQAQLECNQVEIEINEDNTITNIGSRAIDGLIIRKDGVPSEDENYKKVLPVGQTTSYFVEGSGTEIIPGVKPEGGGAPLIPCSDKVIKLR